MTTEVIHKLNITAEASLDIKECLGDIVFDKRRFKADVEEYIQNMSSILPWWGYFRADYEDDDTERLKLFIYKGREIRCNAVLGSKRCMSRKRLVRRTGRRRTYKVVAKHKDNRCSR